MSISVWVSDHKSNICASAKFDKSNTYERNPVLPISKFPCHKLCIQQYFQDDALNDALPDALPGEVSSISAPPFDFDWSQCLVDRNPTTITKKTTTAPWKKLSLYHYFRVPTEILDATEELKFSDNEFRSVYYLFQKIFPSLGKKETCQICKIKINFNFYWSAHVLSWKECDLNIVFNLQWLSTSPFLATNLRVFDFRCREPKNVLDISGIEHAQHLQTLNLSGNRIKNIACLAALFHLCHVDLLETDVTDIESLSNSGPMLLSLNLGMTPVSDLSPLEKMTRLVKLDLNCCQCISDVTPIGFLGHSLLYLDLHHSSGLENECRVVETLSRLVHLLYLNISDNNIYNYEFLSSMHSLEMLNARNTCSFLLEDRFLHRGERSHALTEQCTTGQYITNQFILGLSCMKHLKILLCDHYLWHMQENKSDHNNVHRNTLQDFYKSLAHTTQLEYVDMLSGRFLKTYLTEQKDICLFPLGNIREIDVCWEFMPEVHQEMIIDFDKVLVALLPQIIFCHKFNGYHVVTNNRNSGEKKLSLVNYKRCLKTRLKRRFALQRDYDAVVRVAECLLHDLIDSLKASSHKSNNETILHLNLENACAHVVLKNIVARALAVEINNF